MPTETITSNTTTTLDVPAGRHLLEIYGTFGGLQIDVRHSGSEVSFSGLSLVTTKTAKVITTGGEPLELFTTNSSGSTDVKVRVNSTTTKRGAA